MLLQNDNFFELIGLTTQLKYMMKNILERHGNIHPILNKDEYKHIKDANEYSAFPSLYNLDKINGKTYLGNVESYLLYIKNTLELEEKASKSKPIDKTILNRLKRIWKETKIAMKLYENDYDFTEDNLGDI